MTAQGKSQGARHLEATPSNSPSEIGLMRVYPRDWHVTRSGGNNEEGRRGRRRGKGRGRRGRTDQNAVQKCIFEKLSLADEQGTPILAKLDELIDSYSGDAEVSQVSKVTMLKLGVASHVSQVSKSRPSRPSVGNCFWSWCDQSIRSVWYGHNLNKLYALAVTTVLWGTLHQGR